MAIVALGNKKINCFINSNFYERYHNREKIWRERFDTIFYLTLTRECSGVIKYTFI